MIEPARGAVETLAAELGVTRRFAARLGALAAKGLLLSRALAAEARPGGDWERLLLLRDWLSGAPAAVLENLAAPGSAFADLLADNPLTLIAGDTAPILAFEDEVLAEEAADNPPPGTGRDSATSVVPAPASARTAASVAPGHGPAESAERTMPGGGAAGADALAALRVRIFAGETSTEKVAALRQLAFVDCPPEEKTGIFLQALAEADPVLRAAAAQGLQPFGLDADIAAAARLLAGGNPEEQTRAADRLADLSPSAEALGRGAILTSLLGCLRADGLSDEVAGAALGALSRSAAALGNLAGREEVLRALLEGLLAASPARLAALRETVAALDGAAPGWIAERLAGDFARSGSAEYRTRLLPLLAGLPLDGRLRRNLAPLMADLLLEVPADSPACYQAGRFVLEQGAEGIAILAERLPAAAAAHQRHLLRVLDNARRAAEGLDETARGRLALAALPLLRGGARSVRIDLLETRLIAGPGLEAATAAAIAETLAADLADYAHWQLQENVEDILASLGPAAVEPTARALRENLSLAEGRILAGALGRLGLDLGGRQETLPAASECVRQLQLMGYSPSPSQDAIHIAMGKAAGAAAMPEEVAGLVFRTLWQRLRGESSDQALLEGLGWVAAGPAAGDAARERLAGELLKRWRTAPPTPSLQVIVRDDGEEAFDFSDDLVHASRCWGACLEAMERLAGSENAAPDLRRRLLDGLLEGWARAGEHGFAWGPANAARLTAALGGLGAAAVTPAGERVRIARALSRRIAEPAAILAVVDILAHPDSAGELDALAGGLALRILRTLSEDTELTREDREFWLAALGKLGLHKVFEVRGGGGERVRERMVETLAAGLRGGFWSCRRHLGELLRAGALSGRAQARAQEELSRAGAPARV